MQVDVGNFLSTQRAASDTLITRSGCLGNLGVRGTWVSGEPGCSGKLGVMEGVGKVLLLRSWNLGRMRGHMERCKAFGIKEGG